MRTEITLGRTRRRAGWAACACIALGCVVSSGCGNGKTEAKKKPQTAVETRVFNVTGMTCDGCVNMVRTKIEAVPGVVSAKVSLEEQRAWVELAKNGPSDEAIVDAVTSAGYGATPAPQTQPVTTPAATTRPASP